MCPAWQPVYKQTLKMFNGRWCWFQTLHSKNGVRHIDGLVQERRNSIANALELRLFCTNPSILRPDWPKWQTVFSNAFFKKSVALFCPTSHKPNWANSHHWYRGWVRDKPLLEPMMIHRSLTLIWVTRPQWVNTLHNSMIWHTQPRTYRCVNARKM